MLIGSVDINFLSCFTRLCTCSFSARDRGSIRFLRIVNEKIKKSIPLPPVKIPRRPNTESVPDDVLHRLGLSIVQTSLPKFPSLELRSAGGSRHDPMVFTSKRCLSGSTFQPPAMPPGGHPRWGCGSPRPREGRRRTRRWQWQACHQAWVRL